MAHSSTTNEWATGLLPPLLAGDDSGSCASFARLRSTQQSVQNGQFLCRLAQDALDLLVALHVTLIPCQPKRRGECDLLTIRVEEIVLGRSGACLLWRMLRA
jgi:hypothetical protein